MWGASDAVAVLVTPLMRGASWVIAALDMSSGYGSGSGKRRWQLLAGKGRTRPEEAVVTVAVSLTSFAWYYYADCTGKVR